MREFLVMT